MPKPRETCFPAVQDIYNMVEDNKNLRDNYKQDHQRLLHEQQLNREKKTNILEQNLGGPPGTCCGNGNKR